MRQGKVSDNVLKRSVLKRCRAVHPELVQGPGTGADYAVLGRTREIQLVTAMETAVTDSLQRVRHTVYHAVNNIYCGGGRPEAVMLSVLIPENVQEECLRQIMDAADGACREIGIGMAGGHTEVTSAVSLPVLTVTAMGSRTAQELQKKQPGPGLELVMAGYAALEGTAVLARKKEEELKRQFPLELVETAMGFDSNLSAGPASQIAWECNAYLLHDVSQGGIFGALWEICERAGTGLEADLKKIPIRQETVEICEMYGWNPYCTLSGGALLVMVQDAGRLVDELRLRGIHSAVIGRTTDKKDRILRNGEDFRFLDKPAQDEIYKLEMNDLWQG